jgi:hypothetical protein
VGALLLIAATTLLLYFPLFDAYLWADDFGWLAAGQTFDPASTFSFLHRTHFYRPLVDLYFDLATAVFGYVPRAFHALNVALHIVNACLVFAIAHRLLRAVGAACVAALVFAVLPGINEAVAWVSAVTALLMTLCYLTAVLAHLRWLDARAPADRVVTVIAFVAALLAHEGAVTLLATLLLVDLMFASGWRVPMRDLVRRYGLLALLLVGYLAISFTVNRANSNVIEGEYRVGMHAVRNLLEYVSTLYVGRHGAFALLGTAVALLLVVRFGTMPVRFGAIWMLLALVPYSFFATTRSGRYVYLSAAGFSLLLAGVMVMLLQVLQARIGARKGTLAAMVLATAVTGRFATFAAREVPHAIAPGEAYRAWFESFRRIHPALPRGAAVTIDDPQRRDIDTPALPPLLRLEYADPQLQISVNPPPAR